MVLCACAPVWFARARRVVVDCPESDITPLPSYLSRLLVVGDPVNFNQIPVIRVRTHEVVAILVVLSASAGLGAVGVPVRSGLASVATRLPFSLMMTALTSAHFLEEVPRFPSLLLFGRRFGVAIILVY